MKLGILNCVNCTRRNPTRSAKCVYHTGTLALSTARAGTSCEKEEMKIRNSSSTQWTSSQFQTTSLRKDDLTDTDMGRCRGRQGILHRQPSEEEMQEEGLPRYP